MASDVNPGNVPVASPVHGSLAANDFIQSGEPLPAASKPTPIPTSTAGTAAAAAVPGTPGVREPISLPSGAQASDADAADLVTQLNKFLNTSGLPDQFRMDPGSGGKVIQQINPTNGEVIGQFAVNEFPALARGVGVAGLLVDSLA